MILVTNEKNKIKNESVFIVVVVVFKNTHTHTMKVLKEKSGRNFLGNKSIRKVFITCTVCFFLIQNNIFFLMNKRMDGRMDVVFFG